MHVTVDDRARQALGRQRSGQALLVTILSSYGLPNEALSVEWCSRHEAEHDPTLTKLGQEGSVPVYVHRRVAAYARWRPLRLTAKTLLWWPRIAVADGDAVLRDLTRWERAHPGLRVLDVAHAA